jgi:hypothetical protein
MKSPLFEALLKEWKANKNAILDASTQLNYLLEETQIDVSNQFSQKQGEWKDLAEYTVKKKQAMKADKRILHQTKVGEGERLRDAYAKTGMVDNNRLIYHYPSSKPYAIEHQEGATIEKPDKKRKEKKRRTFSKNNEEDYLDAEFFRKAYGIFIPFDRP